MKQSSGQEIYMMQHFFDYTANALQLYNGNAVIYQKT